LYMDPGMNPHLKFTNLRDHGYLLLSLNEHEVKADWYYVDIVSAPSIKEQIGMSYTLKKRKS